ncbi:hypothetical protein [Leptospira alstonii]|uniref:Uncharacterized protein n=2 Tax=Leptospira alstonii TaxID=28452 RepID=M6D157_9LEPT|nr:hypothetical protein [Leptospira alstonii]EMJ92320.1 hypothetical protein LEP1GSC194_0236 [Leptospira alstonii serovar Sichuan str. 79601]EQA78872.1 hypothetical protein LEP1GSC193_2831 [Leptospira alstonii serovar Pingchang str. 80-412]
MKKLERAEEVLQLPVATGEALKKLNLAGIWKDREIGDSTAYSQALRKKLASRMLIDWN